MSEPASGRAATDRHHGVFDPAAADDGSGKQPWTRPIIEEIELENTAGYPEPAAQSDGISYSV